MDEKERELSGIKKRSHHPPKPQTIHEIHNAINDLENRGEKVTISSIAKVIGISKQRVHQVLKISDELSILDNAQQRERKLVIAEALKAFDTAFLSTKEIQNLPIDGIKDMPINTLYTLLIDHNIPHSFTAEEKLSTIDTSQYTARELHELIGGSFRTMRQILYKNKIPFKSNRRNRRDVAAILGKLKTIDTSQYTAQELHSLIDRSGTLAAFCNILSNHKIPHKSVTRNREEMATLLEKLKTVDTNQYTAQELYEIFGEKEALKTFRYHLRNHNIPYKKIQGKDRRPKEEMAPIWEKLHSIDTEQYTADELVSLLDNKIRKNVMLKYLDKNRMKYKKKRGANNFDKLLNIDTSQYTAQELHSMTGGNLKQLQNYLAKHKFSYKKAKSGPKPKNQRANH
ncbi:hypothetical protein [Burkholderia multivorans]|uniref:hypothetical protein n=1 Tax=Burkholderia multivorans TaxID=87883 RepID=UPI0011B1F643|nr:hypothetical protein [Burkholderia multivorans]